MPKNVRDSGAAFGSRKVLIGFLRRFLLGNGDQSRKGRERERKRREGERGEGGEAHKFISGKQIAPFTLEY